MGRILIKRPHISRVVTRIAVAVFVITALAGCGTEKEEKTVGEANEDVQQEGNLYERFLNGEAAATVGENYLSVPESYPLEKGRAYTLEELGKHVNSNYLNPEYRFDGGRTSYDEIQYAYMECLDSDGKNLLVKFSGLDIYSENDDSYAVMVVAENGGQLYIIYQYDYWARSYHCAYKNGQIASDGSSGAGDHGSSLDVVLSNGDHAQVYKMEALNGEWISFINDKIYKEVFGGNLDLASNSNWVMYIITIGDEKYYHYDMDECSEEEKSSLKDYIERCREEASINWVTDEVVREAVKNRCAKLGFDYEKTKERVEVAWTSL